MTWWPRPAARSCADPSDPCGAAPSTPALVEPGSLFVALPGERTDGHRFLGRGGVVGGRGAPGLAGPDPGTGEAPLDELGDVTIVRVPDTLRGLQAVAAAWRTRFDPLVVGVTGSIAKTSTKEQISRRPGRPLADAQATRATRTTRSACR